MTTCANVANCTLPRNSRNFMEDDHLADDWNAGDSTEYTLSALGSQLHVLSTITSYKSGDLPGGRGVDPIEDSLVHKRILYESLPSTDSIRLFRIKPNQQGKRVVACTLETHQYETDETFVALSYTWSLPSSAPTEEESGWISDTVYFCNNTELRLTPSLHSVLDRFVEEGFACSLWIDAICINQNDNAEKAQQIALMGSIYNRAHVVLVWLGERTEKLEDFVWINTKLKNALVKAYRDNGEDWDTVLQTPLDDLAVEDLSGCRDISTVLARYFDFVKTRRWWSRTWVIQEVVLARDVMVLCGKHIFRWEELSKILQMLRDSSWVTDVPSPRGPDRFNIIRSFFHGSDPGSEMPQSLKSILTDLYGATTNEELAVSLLFHLWIEVVPTGCFDPHDKIYGILSLVRWYFPQFDEKFVPVDYDLSMHDFNLIISKLFLRHIPSLAPLAFSNAQKSSNFPDLPSWALDVSKSENLRCLSYQATSVFDASNFRSRQPGSRSIVGKTLGISGACFDYVDSTCTCNYRQLFEDSLVEEMLSFCVSALSAYNKDNWSAEIIWRTLIADTDSRGNVPASTAIGTEFRTWLGQRAAQNIFMNCATADDEEAAFSRWELLLRQFDASSEASDLLHVDIIRYWLARIRKEGRSAVETMEGGFSLKMWGTSLRRLYKTQRNFLGLGPESVAVGDEVCLLEDGLTPFLLREASSDRHNDREFTLVGQTYLHGFMHGSMRNPQYGIGNKMGAMYII